MRDRLKVVFLPNFNVTNGQRIYPAADLSEQISTAGKEASGTGNMKFCMNGALTIGTLDGANIEIREEVGADNFFLFGLTRAGGLRAEGARAIGRWTTTTPTRSLREVIDLIRGGFFSRGDTGAVPAADRQAACTTTRTCCSPISPSYVECQAKVSEAYRDAERWTRMSILNTARSGKFSSDRTIREYCSGHLARASPVPIQPAHAVAKQEAHSAAQRLGGAPQQLIAHGEGGEVFAAHRQLAQPADGYRQACR